MYYIIEKLAGKHTITVEHLAHLARTKNWDATKLRNKLEEKKFPLEFHKDGKLINIQKPYEILYDLFQLTKAEQNLLEAFSLFPYLSLAAKVCNDWLLEDADIKEEENAIFELYEKGWLQLEEDNYLMHPMFAQFIFDKCKLKEQFHKNLLKTYEKYLELPENGSILYCQKYLPFAETIDKKLDKIDKIQKSSFENSIDKLLHYIGKYESAEKYYEKALKIREEVLGENHPDTASSYNNLAIVYYRQERYEEAETLYKKVIKIREEMPDL